MGGEFSNLNSKTEYFSNAFLFNCQFNKRMINGSLMCLSSDNFETFFFATITGERNPVTLAQGKFKIKLEIEYELMPEITPAITYIMVESQVYFEVR